MWSWRCPQPPKEKRKPKTPTKPESTASFLTFCNPSNCSVCLVWFGSPCVRVCVDKVNLSNESRPLHCYKGISMWISCQELAKARLVLVSPPNVPTFRETLPERTFEVSSFSSFPPRPPAGEVAPRSRLQESAKKHLLSARS